MTEDPESETPQGALLVRLDWIGTIVFAVAAALAVAFPDSRHHGSPAHLSLFPGVFAVLSLALFLWGCGAFAWGYALAVGRSRTEQIELANLFFLAGDSAPDGVRRSLRWACGAQVVIALVAAGLRPYSELAFGIMVPVFGLGMIALWGARYGRFPDRVARRPESSAPPGVEDRPE